MAMHDFFSKCRVPGKDEDISLQTDITESKHVVIMRNGHVSPSCMHAHTINADHRHVTVFQFFKLDVFYECPDGTLALAPPTHIVEQLQAIMEAAPSTCEHPVGILTSEHRDCWYKTRQQLMLGTTIACFLGYYTVPEA